MNSSEHHEKLQNVLSTAQVDFQKGMRTHAYFKLSDRLTSEDVVQDAFLKTWSYLVKGGKVHIMKAFLYHILNHLIVDEYRKRKNVSLDLLLEKGFEPSTDPSNRLVNVVDGKAAMLLIGRLPEKYQKVIRMRFVQDLSLKDMSLVTGQSANAISVQIHRGLKMLRLLYNPTGA